MILAGPLPLITRNKRGSDGTSKNQTGHTQRR